MKRRRVKYASRRHLDDTPDKLPALLARLRSERWMSQRHLADAAGVNVSVVHHAERGRDARLSTWDKLFGGLGCRFLTTYVDIEECGDYIQEENERRLRRREEGLLKGSRRWR